MLDSKHFTWLCPSNIIFLYFQLGLTLHVIQWVFGCFLEAFRDVHWVWKTVGIKGIKLFSLLNGFAS